ncbi:MAG: hypothetical protein ACO1TE_29110 [Prosthecobacter sp.]
MKTRKTSKLVIESAVQAPTANREPRTENTGAAAMRAEALAKVASYFSAPRWEWIKRRSKLHKGHSEAEVEELRLGALAAAAMSVPDNAATALCVAARCVLINVGGQPTPNDDERMQAALATGVLPPPTAAAEAAPAHAPMPDMASPDVRAALEAGAGAGAEAETAPAAANGEP